MGGVSEVGRSADDLQVQFLGLRCGAQAQVFTQDLGAGLVLPYGRYPIAQAEVAAHQLPVGSFPVWILSNQALVLFDGPLKIPSAGVQPGQCLEGIQMPFPQPFSL